jgi:hypothetical protein
MKDLRLQFTDKEPAKEVQRLTKSVAVPRVTTFINTEIEDPMAHMAKLGLIKEQNDEQVDNKKKLAQKAREAVSGFTQTNNTRKAVEALADAIEQS